MRKLLNIFMMMAVVSLVVNCSDESKIPVEVDESAEEQNFLDSMSAQGVISQMYEVQENGTYTFKRGRNINSSEPNKYYYVCSDAKEAALFYNNYCTYEPLEVAYEKVGDSLVVKFDAVDRKSTFGDYGYTSLTIGGEDPVFATIELSFDAVGETHELIFVPESYMPFNSDYKAFRSPYTLGDIYKDKYGNQWLCVMESQPARDGYFVRLTDGDNVYWERWCAKDNYKSAWFAVEKPGYTIAGKDAWDSFCRMVPYDQGKNAMLVMEKGTDGVSMNATLDLMKTLNGENQKERRFQVGRARTSDKNFHWRCFSYLYEVWITFIHIHGGSYWIAESYSWHEFNTRGGNIYEDSLKSGQEMLQISFRNSKLPDMVKQLFPNQTGRF